MTIKLSSRGGVIPVMRAGAVTLILIAGLLLAGCSGLNSSTAVVSQGSANAAPVKPGNAESAILTDLHGTVEVKTGDGQWALAQPGQTLKSGQQIRTGSMSNVAVAFYDGSRMQLGAEAQVALDALNAGTTGPRVVQLTQVSGESQHEVAKSDDPGSHYDVNTPSGNGSTTGTKFTVMVLPDRLSQFWVDEGFVSVVNANATVKALAGQTTTSAVGQPPTEPAFRISGEGQVMQIGNGSSPATPPSVQNNQNGKVTLCHATGSATNPYVEITVSMQGAANGHEKHAGDIIPAPANGCPQSTSAVPVQWNIAGQIFNTGANTVIFGNPQVGDWVSFEGHLLADGSRFADRIVLLNHSPENQFAIHR